MKRCAYGIKRDLQFDTVHPVLMDDPKGDVVRHEEVRASVERLLGVAKTVPHATGCKFVTYGVRPEPTCIVDESKCNCPRGELLAGLKEMAK